MVKKRKISPYVHTEPRRDAPPPRDSPRHTPRKNIRLTSMYREVERSVSLAALPPSKPPLNGDDAPVANCKHVLNVETREAWMCFLQDHDRAATAPMVCNANVFPPSLPSRPAAATPAFLLDGSGGYKFDDHRREPGKTGRWYVPRIFQTSFNNFAVNSRRWWRRRWLCVLHEGRCAEVSAKNGRNGGGSEILKLMRERGRGRELAHTRNRVLYVPTSPQTP